MGEQLMLNILQTAMIFGAGFVIGRITSTKRGE